MLTSTLLALLTVAAPAPAPVAPTEATVVDVIDGDTIDVSIGGRIERIRLIGIDADEADTPCGTAVTAFAAQALPVGEPVVLTPGAVDDRDAYDRLLRYISVANPNDDPAVEGDEMVDFGGYLLGGGLAIPRYDSTDGYGAHPQELAYYAIAAVPILPECHAGYTEAVQEVAQEPVAQQPVAQQPVTQQPVTQPPAPAPEPEPEPAAAGGCDPNYSGCVPIDSDVDCAGGSGNGPSYTGQVQVIGADVYGLDSDGDGVGCE